MDVPDLLLTKNLSSLTLTTVPARSLSPQPSSSHPSSTLLLLLPPSISAAAAHPPPPLAAADTEFEPV
ncbi:hypothetical protein Droror1_Dr00012518 [Drosera rotundifolia]